MSDLQPRDVHRLPRPGDSAEAESSDGGVPRFIADVNVGKLAKWLRILGYDTLFINPIEDGELVEIALREGRVVLTRDTHIAERRAANSGQVRVVVVEGDRLADQLRFLVREMGLKGLSRMFSRCIECNVPLQPIDRSLVQDQVPPYVYRTQDRYMICPRCGKIYWPGTHWQRMRETAESLFEGREQGTGNREQGTGNREQGTGNRQQATGNREQGTGNKQQATGNREKGTGNREQGIGNRE